MTVTAAADRSTRLVAPEARLAQMGAPLDPSRYDWETAGTGELSDDEIFQVTYAAQVEWGTEGTFASLDISRDPIVRRFLRIWLDQEVVHAQLLARVLHRSGASVAPIHRDRKH